MADTAREKFTTAKNEPVSTVGLGGENILRTANRTSQARRVIRAAIDRGITYFDSARVYQDSELYLGSVRLKTERKPRKENERKQYRNFCL